MKPMRSVLWPRVLKLRRDAVMKDEEASIQR
jgi:hypothetical protein